MSLIILLPLALPYLRRDWPILRTRLPFLMVLSLTGISLSSVCAYWSVQYTQALNALLVQSSGSLFVALWALILFGVRLTGGQAVGIAISLAGVFTILLRGDLMTIATIDFNRGDLIYLLNMIIVGAYLALMARKPQVHPLSLLTAMVVLGVATLMPLLLIEISTGFTIVMDFSTIASLFYVCVFASVLAFLMFNRGIELIGPNRASPFFHLVPVFGSVMAIVFLGEQMRLFHVIGYVLVLLGIFVASRRPASLHIQ